MTTILDGTVVREHHVAMLRQRIVELDTPPVLHIIQIGSREDSTAYVAQKKKWGRQVGIVVKHTVFNEDVSFGDVEACIAELNGDKQIDGVIIQLPLPQHLDAVRLGNMIDPAKDVDGLTDTNQEKLRQGDLSGLLPATARGVISLLNHYHIGVRAMEVVVIGRSRLVGGPIAALLTARGAKVQVCHSETPDILTKAQAADIIVSATGVPGLVTKEYVKSGAVVIDVGINAVDGNSLEEEIPAKKFVGDVVFDEVKEVAAAITPVPGGVGPMTVVSLLENVTEAHMQRLEL